jgi:peptide subunit release factor 1 (eRF1)
MLTESDIRDLLSYEASAPVLSIYLNAEPEEGGAEAAKLRLRNMLKEVDLPEDVEAVLRYFDHEHDWSGRSVVVFSCAPERYWQVYSLAVPIRSRVRVSSQPYVKPLADLLDYYGGYGVVLIDKQGARLFSFHLGELREQDGFLGKEVRHTKRGGGSQAPGRRGGTAGQTNYVEEISDRNMRDVVEYATQFFKDNHVRRVLIGGTEDNIAQFRTHLPKSWQSLVVGAFPMSMVASHHEVFQRAMEVGREAEQRREADLVSAVVTAAAKGRGGVLQLEDTLRAVHEGRVQTLLIQDGFRAPGCRCQSCGYVSGRRYDFCPFCGGSCEEIPDAVDLAVRQVMQAGGEVEVLHGSPAFSGFSTIGALVRY